MSEEKKKLRNMEIPFVFEEYDKFEKKFTYKYWPLSDNSLSFSNNLNIFGR